jgi:Fic-DOC domain mobile mystery protein B
VSALLQAGDGNTEISPEEMIQLILPLSTRAELNQAERVNINSARVWAMKAGNLKRTDLVTDAFSRELHRRMFNGVWGWAGHFRTTEKNIGWETHRLLEGVRVAFDDAQYWLSNATYPETEIVVRLHHRLVRVHPWPNGNGRHARLMADVILVSRGHEALNWGSHLDLTATGEARTRYLEAIRAADQLDYAPLLAFAVS